MILIFWEDGTVEVADSAEDAVIRCEGIDVHCDVCHFYDGRGRVLRPVFDVPVTEKRFLFFFKEIDSGKYHLVPEEEGEESGADPIHLALAEAVLLERNPYFKTLDELKDSLRKNGVIVDFPQYSVSG